MIGFNVQPLAAENLTGIGNYAADVLKCLIPKYKDYEIHVFNFFGRNNTIDFIDRHIGGHYRSEALSVVKLLPLSLYIRMGKLGKILPYHKLTKSSADVTIFFNYLAPEGFTGKNIITIYDMVCERFPETMDDRNRKLLQRHLKKSAENASAIVTISEFSKQEIIDILGIPSEKIFVAHCGTDTEFYKPSASVSETKSERDYINSKWGISKYILYVGTLEPRKNAITLVKAFNKIAATDNDVKLVLTGGIGWHAEETLEAIKNSPFADRIIMTGYVSNEEKRMLYRNAGVFVFPSMYEGFGMPVTEAMACGTPCIVADSSSLLEISDGLALLVDTFDVDDYVEVIEDVLQNGIPDEIKSKMIDSVKRFSWENAAKVYEDAVLYAKST